MYISPGLRNALLCAALQSQFFVKILPKNLLNFSKFCKILQNSAKILKNFAKFWQILANFWKKCDFRAVQRSALCRSRRELSNAYLLAKFRFDTAENEPCQVCPSKERHRAWCGRRTSSRTCPTTTGAPPCGERLPDQLFGVIRNTGSNPI